MFIISAQLQNSSDKNISQMNTCEYACMHVRTIIYYFSKSQDKHWIKSVWQCDVWHKSNDFWSRCWQLSWETHYHWLKFDWVAFVGALVPKSQSPVLLMTSHWSPLFQITNQWTPLFVPPMHWFGLVFSAIFYIKYVMPFITIIFVSIFVDINDSIFMVPWLLYFFVQ